MVGDGDLSSAAAGRRCRTCDLALPRSGSLCLWLSPNPVLQNKMLDFVAPLDTNVLPPQVHRPAHTAGVWLSAQGADIPSVAHLPPLRRDHSNTFDELLSRGCDHRFAHRPSSPHRSLWHATQRHHHAVAWFATKGGLFLCGITMHIFHCFISSKSTKDRR